MAQQDKRSDVSLKQCWMEGGGVDLVLLLVSSAMMDCGTLSMVTLFVIIAHITAGVYLALSFKWRHRYSTRFFIRFGGWILLLIALLARSVVSLF